MYSISLRVINVIRGNVNQAFRYKRKFTKNNRTVDPGIQHRKGLVDEDAEWEQLNDYDFDLEADFMNVATTHKEYESEQQLLREKEKYLIVKQKYFKQKLPNFLTWSDKEQIRYLHTTNPEEWTLEKLSDGFPALPEVIAKIVKARWTKISEHKIQNHDESVKKNWILFKEGKFDDLPSKVVDHLKQFTNRDLNFKGFNIPEQFKTDSNVKSMIAPNITVGSEFSEIIRSYKYLKNKDIKTDIQKLSSVNSNKLQNAPKKDTYLIEDLTNQYGKQITFGNLQQQLQKKAKDEMISPEEELILRDLQQEKADNQQQKFINHLEEDLQPTIVMDNTIDKYKGNTQVINKPEAKILDNNVLNYPENIIIPKNKFKKGYTYKLNDCYYDDDGEFLYRIPGMYK